MNQSEMTAKIKQGDGFIAALDQSGGSTPNALAGYGVQEGAWSTDEEMFAQNVLLADKQHAHVIVARRLERAFNLRQRGLIGAHGVNGDGDGHRAES